MSKDPMDCSPDSGFCEIPSAKPVAGIGAHHKDPKKKAPMRIIYFTDPICSSCWGMEPQLRRLKLEYGDSFEMEYRMGGLLPDWSYNAGGISKPSDVASHWEDASRYYQMPIDGSLWLEDPLPSSYPPSIAFKAAQLQNQQKAISFLRRLREMVFMEKKNITRPEHLRQAAIETGLNANQLQKDMEGPALKDFHQDLELTRSLGVRGFPTLIFANQDGKMESNFGSKPYSEVEASLKKFYPQAVKIAYEKNTDALFARYPSLTSLEFATLSGNTKAEAEKVLNELSDQGKLRKISIRNGSIWMLNP